MDEVPIKTRRVISDGTLESAEHQRASMGEVIGHR